MVIIYSLKRLNHTTIKSMVENNNSEIHICEAREKENEFNSINSRTTLRNNRVKGRSFMFIEKHCSRKTVLDKRKATFETQCQIAHYCNVNWMFFHSFGFWVWMWRAIRDVQLLCLVIYTLSHQYLLQNWINFRLFRFAFVALFSIWNFHFSNP